MLAVSDMTNYDDRVELACVCTHVSLRGTLSFQVQGMTMLASWGNRFAFFVACRFFWLACCINTCAQEIGFRESSAKLLSVLDSRAASQCHTCPKLSEQYHLEQK